MRLADVPTRGRPREASASLKSARVALRKRFGQHLLKNADVVKNIVAAANLQPHESVFEIGPGTGNMTVHLLSQAKVVYAVELDHRLHSVVTARAAQLGLGHKFQCVRGDFLEVPLPAFDVLVANIPYQISSPVLRRIFAHSPLPNRAVIMFQKEFVDRIVAQPGTADYCRLSVNTQLLCSSPDGKLDGVKMVMKIGKEQFRPPPKVDSAVATFKPRPGGWASVCSDWPQLPASISAIIKASSPDARFLPDFDDWDCFLRLCFGGKNKTLRAIFSNKNTLSDLLSPLASSVVGAERDAAATVEPANPVAICSSGGFHTDDDAHINDENENEDDEEIDVASESDGQSISAGAGSRRRNEAEKQSIAALRSRIHDVITSLHLSDKRPNALRIVDYQSLYRALSEGLGLNFRPTLSGWGKSMQRQRSQPPLEGVVEGDKEGRGLR